MSLQKVIVFLQTQSKQTILDSYSSLESETSSWDGGYTALGDMDDIPDNHIEDKFASKKEFEQVLLWIDKNKDTIDFKSIQEVESEMAENLNAEIRVKLKQSDWSLVGSVTREKLSESCGGPGEPECPSGFMPTIESYIHNNKSALFISFKDDVYLTYAADMSKDPDYKHYYEKGDSSDGINLMGRRESSKKSIEDKIRQIIESLDFSIK